MLTTSTEYKSAIIDRNRRLTFHIYLSGSETETEFPVASVLSIKITKRGASQQKLMPGEFCKAQCKMVTTAQVIGSFRITVTVSGASDVLPLGTYWVNTCDYDEGPKRYTVIAYDVPPWMDSTCNTASRDVHDILSTIESSSGMTITNKSAITLSAIESVVEDATWADVLADIAGYNGYSVRTNAGALEFYKYQTVDYEIPPSLIYATGLRANKDDTTIGYYIVNERFTVGSGSYGIAYQNPYITTQEEADAMAYYVNQTYTPMHVKYKGDPALQIGDIITVRKMDGTTMTCMVMDLDFTIDGGLLMEINCYSDEQTRSVISEKPIDRKLRELRAYTQSSVERIMDTIFSADHGYYFEIDANGDPITGPGQTPAGFQITDASMTQGWRFILGGLYHSNDGFQSVSNLAISADGQIYGQFLALNSVGAEALEINAQNVVNGAIKNFTFGDDGFRIALKNADGTIASKYNSLFTQDGMRVLSTSTDSATLIAEGDTVDANNLTAHVFFRVQTEVTETGTTNVHAITDRFQGFWSVVHNAPMVAVFVEDD